MGKPILIPGHPGDLIGIISVARLGLQEIRRTDPDNREKVRGIALKTNHALLMWLGIVPVEEGDT